VKGAPAWRGHWYERIIERIYERGFETAAQFADSQPMASLVTLARQLGKNKDVAGAQLEKVLLHEAEVAGTMERCARSLLVRKIHEELPEGWHTDWDEDSRYRRAGAFSSWFAGLGSSSEPAVDRIYGALEGAPLPEGWLPAGPDDPILVEIFQKYWDEPKQEDSPG
jgi:hypothetical protein